MDHVEVLIDGQWVDIAELTPQIHIKDITPPARPTAQPQPDDRGPDLPALDLVLAATAGGAVLLLSLGILLLIAQ